MIHQLVYYTKVTLVLFITFYNLYIINIHTIKLLNSYQLISKVSGVTLLPYKQALKGPYQQRRVKPCVIKVAVSVALKGRNHAS